MLHLLYTYWSYVSQHAIQAFAVNRVASSIIANSTISSEWYEPSDKKNIVRFLHPIYTYVSYIYHYVVLTHARKGARPVLVVLQVWIHSLSTPDQSDVNKSNHPRSAWRLSVTTFFFRRHMLWKTVMVAPRRPDGRSTTRVPSSFSHVFYVQHPIYVRKYLDATLAT